MSDSVTKYNERMSDREIMNAKRGLGTSFYPDTKYTPPTDKFVDKVIDNFKQRSQTGIEKYGTTLERDDVDLLGWLTHLQEELMDATLYIEKLKSEVTNNS